MNIVNVIFPVVVETLAAQKQAADYYHLSLIHI